MNTISTVLETDWKVNPYEHHALLMLVLGNGYPPSRIWDWEVRGHPVHTQFFLRTSNDDD